MTSTRFGNLFTIELMHRYYSNKACSDFIIKPSAETIDVLNGDRIEVRQYKNRLYAGTQVTPDEDPAVPVPFIIPGEDMQLTFFLQLTNPLFFNFTDIALSYSTNKIYYFSNRCNNTVGGKSYLHNSEYMTEDNALKWMPSKSVYHLPNPTSSADIKVFSFNGPPDNFTLILENTINFNSDTPRSFILDLSTLRSGKYKLIINGDEQLIYVNDELSTKPVFGVIDIFNDSTLQNDYKLLGASNLLKSPFFAIYFLNRSTRWKYILNADTKGIISTSGYNFPTSEDNPIYSSSNIPLSETPLTVGLKGNAIKDGQSRTIDIPKVACASPERLTTYKDGAHTYYCSEIFLNY